MAGEGERQTYLEETYKTVLNPRTVLVETTDCEDDEWIRNVSLSDGPLEKWWGGGGGTKKNTCKEKCQEKKKCK